MAKTIEEEILEVYGVPRRKRGESAQAYYARLVKASSEGTEQQQDAAWEKLGNAAQEWINNCVVAKKAGRDYVSFPDAPPEEEEKAPAPVEEERRPPRSARARPAEEEAAPAPARRTRAPRKAKVEARADEAPPARRRRVVDDTPAPAPARRRIVDDTPAPAPARRRAAGKRGNGGTGVYALTQEFVVKNPNASTADIMKALEKKGLTPQQHTVQSVRGHTRDTLKLVQRIRNIDVGLTV